MKECNKMRPPDCYKPNNLQNQSDTLDDKIKQFNLRHPMIQLRFNIHDCYHRPSCFKKGPECRTELPQKHRQIATIQFDKNNTINWYFIDGSIKKIAPFKYHPKRNIGDQFMNVNNDIATTVLACNNNVTSGDKACFFYVTLYQTKHNQKEEAFNYHNVCLALSKRIKFHQETLTEHSNNEEVTEEVSPDFAEGLKRMLASLYGHTSKNVLSSTMAAKLLTDGERFKFSHEFTAIPLKHLLEWLNGEEELEFKLRKVKKEDGKYEHIHDMFINNIIYRPVELEKFGCYDMITRYDLRRMSKEKIESNNLIVESKKTFNLVEEHPSHKCMVMSERTHFHIPCINSLNLLPNIAELHQFEETNDPNIIDMRERYAAIILLLFYPYRSQDDLELNGSYWNKYKYVIENNMLSAKSLEVCQNIQDVSYNCSKLKQAKDELQQTTVFTPHENDNNRKCNQEDNTASVEEIVDMLQQIDDYGVRDVDPKMRRLSIIGERHNIVQQDVPTTNHIIPNITDIPEGIDLTKNSEILNNDSNETSDQESNKLSNVSSKMNCPMIIDILNDTILNNLESNYTYFNNTSTKT